MESKRAHWNSIFSNSEASKLGWYEKNAPEIFKLLNLIPLWEDATIFIPGAGTSTLVEQLLSKGAKLVLNDISNEAILELKTRLAESGHAVRWLCQDISRPIQDDVPEINIWIDRAVLHFLREEDDIEGYFQNLKTSLKVGGYALFAEFSKSGARKCAGLSLHRYSVEELSNRLGSSFEQVAHFDHTYINPDGAPRPYLYALYKRLN